MTFPLPTEILEWIASFLDVDSYHRFRKVSKQTYRISRIPYLQFEHFRHTFGRARLNLSKFNDRQFLELIHRHPKGVEMALNSPRMSMISPMTLNKAFQIVKDYGMYCIMELLVSYYQQPDGHIPFEISSTDLTLQNVIRSARSHPKLAGMLLKDKSVRIKGMLAFAVRYDRPDVAKMLMEIRNVIPDQDALVAAVEVQCTDTLKGFLSDSRVGVSKKVLDTAVEKTKNYSVLDVLLKGGNMSSIEIDTVCKAIKKGDYETYLLLFNDSRFSAKTFDDVLRMLTAALQVMNYNVIRHLISLQIVPLDRCLSVLFSDNRQVPFRNFKFILRDLPNKRIELDSPRNEQTMVNMFKEAMQWISLEYCKYLVEVVGCDPTCQQSAPVKTAVQSSYAIAEYFLSLEKVGTKILDHLDTLAGAIMAEVNNLEILFMLLERPEFVRVLGECIVPICNKGNFNVLEVILRNPNFPKDHDLYPAFLEALKGNHYHCAYELAQFGTIDFARNDFEAVRYLWHSTMPDLIKLALEYPEIDPSAFDNQAIITIAGHRNAPVLQRLLQDPRVDPAARNNAALKAVLARDSVLNTESPNIFEETMRMFFEETVDQSLKLQTAKLLVKDPRVDPSVSDQSLLLLAACQHDFPFFKQLLNDPRIDPYFKNGKLILEMVKRHLSDCLYAVLKFGKPMPLDLFKECMKIVTNGEGCHCSSNNLSTLRHLLSTGHPVHGIPNLLRHYIQHNNYPSIDLLLTRPEVDIKKEDILLAIKCSAIHILALLLRDERANPIGEPFQTVLKSGKWQLIRLFLLHPKVKLDARSSLKMYLEAKQFSDGEVLNVLRPKVDLEKNYNIVELVDAVVKCDVDKVKAFLPAIKPSMFGHNFILYKVIRYSSPQVLRVFLSDPRVSVSHDANAPFMFACTTKKVAMVKEMLKCDRIDPTDQDYRALDIARGTLLYDVLCDDERFEDYASEDDYSDDPMVFGFHEFDDDDDGSLMSVDY